jgi:hypothetical protein
MTQEGFLVRRRTARLWLVIGAAVLAAIVILVVVANGAVRSGSGAPRGDDASAGGAASPQQATSTPKSTPSKAPATDAASPPPNSSAPPAAAPGQPAAQAPVTFTEPAAPVPGVTFSISGLEAVQGVANGPGEVGGPALRFTLNVRNDTAAAVSLTSTVVNLFAGPDRAPAVELGEPGGVPLPESVAPGASATGVFVFTVPVELRNQVQISVDYAVDAPVVLFEGAAPR